ncbi:hypothetical protein F5X99DRAFT_381440 [Biscogniauxia marginata]|nr:hypothetical protein F5X99DRAFT_381440 [Biscogniauxia marginata]
MYKSTQQTLYIIDFHQTHLLHHTRLLLLLLQRNPLSVIMNTSMSRSELRAHYSKIEAAQGEIKKQQEHLLKESLNRILQDQSITFRDKILLQMRASEESWRRSCEYRCSAYVPTTIPYQLSISSVSSSVATSYMALCSNITTALYIFDKRQHFPYVRAMDIEPWLWRQWFKPYVSDITRHYFSSIFAVEYDANLADCEFHSEKLVAFHCNIYEQAQRIRDAAFPEEENDGSTPAIHGPLRSQPWLWKESNFQMWDFRRRAAYVIQPLFRALFIALFYPQGGIYGIRTPEQLLEVKVQLILTGTTEGLSAPISFEELRDEALDGSYHPGATAITIGLDAAVRFIIRLEQREVAAAGGVFQPDVAKLRGWNRHREYAKKFGWIEERDGNLDDLTPRSCEWVNQNIFKKWVGEGAEKILKYALNEHSMLNPLREDSEENWWWDRKLLPEKPAKAKTIGPTRHTAAR